MIPDPFHLMLFSADSASGKFTVLFIYADNFHFTAVYIIKRRRSQKMIQHGIRNNISVQKIPDTQIIYLTGHNSIQVKIFLICNQFFKFRYRHGTVIIKSLRIAAAHIDQELLLILCFHAFHHDRESHLPRHAEHRLQDFHSFLFFHLAEIQETGIQLQYIHGHIFQHIQ